jgi:hypothetical protein
MTLEEIEEEWKKMKKAQLVLIEQQTEKMNFLLEALYSKCTDCRINSLYVVHVNMEIYII